MRRDLHETDVIYRDRNTVVRHSALVRLQHWAIALSGIFLLFSGFGQLPVYKRYMLDQVPGFGWSSNFIVNFNIHAVASVVFVFATVFHFVYHYMEGGKSILPRKGDFKESIQIIAAMFRGREEPPSHKFLAEQRLAYAFISFSIVLLIATGFFKFLDNYPTANLPYWVTFWSTTVHNIATVLFLFGFLAHVGAFLLKANWPLFASMFTGRVRLDYAEHRHPLWIDDIKRGVALTGKMTVEGAVRIMAGTMVWIGVLFGVFVSPWWYLLPAFVAVNLIQSSFTNWCLFHSFIERLWFGKTVKG